MSRVSSWAGWLALGLSLLANGCSQKGTQPNPAGTGNQSPTTGQTPTPAPTPAPGVENYPALLAQAQEVNDAFRRRDFARMVDLTYPKVIEAAGGRDKMIAALAKGMKEMESEGVSVLSSTAEAPIQIVHVQKWTYAVVPTTLQVKAKDGVFRTESSMIGISSDQGANWTFIDAGGKDHTQLKSYLPAPADALKLPGDKEPVKISGN
jgi:hypothetical protein